MGEGAELAQPCGRRAPQVMKAPMADQTTHFCNSGVQTSF
jgi:hypothetical protein